MTAVDVVDMVCEKCGNLKFNLVYDAEYDTMFLLCSECDREHGKVRDWSLLNTG